MARSNDPVTWSTFEEATSAKKNGEYTGVGFVLTPPFVGIDFDHVRDPSTGTIDPEVMAELNLLDSYSEVSPSGAGIHVFVTGTLPGKRCRKGPREMYQENRFFTVTGSHLEGTPDTINPAQPAIDALYRKWFGADPVDTSALTDEQVIETCRKKFGASFTALWEGDLTHTPSQSEADLALCGKLAAVTHDRVQIDRIFRGSKLFRPKWDEQRGEDKYGAITVKKALEKPTRRSGKIDEDEEKPHKTLTYFEKDGKIYLSAITPGQTFQFVHEDQGKLVFNEEVLGSDGCPIVPRGLDRHKNTGEQVKIVGYPRMDLLVKQQPPTPQELFARIATHMRRYIDVPETDLEMFIYYILYTWFYTKCQTALYLRLLADTGKGKSRILHAVSDLCFYPVTLAGASSYSGIMRTKEKYQGTLRVDESDLNGGASNSFIKYLNLGFERGQYYVLSDKNDPNKQDYFDPFGPKVIAMREPFGDIATEGRCLSFTPSETRRRDIPPELNREYYTAVDDMRASIALLVLHNWAEIDGENLIDCTDIPLEPRLVQMSRPLSIVLQMFPDGQDRFRTYLLKRQTEVKEVRAQSFEGQLFNYVASLALGDDSLFGHPKYCEYYHENMIQAVTASMVADEFKISPKSVTRCLGGIGIVIENDKIITGSGTGTKRKSVKKYVVESSQRWNEILQRYAAEDMTDRLATCPEILRGRKWIEGRNHVQTFLNENPLSTPGRCPDASVATEETVSKGTLGDTDSSLATVPGEHTMVKENDRGSSEDLCLPTGVDTSSYRRISRQRIGQCIAKGCTEQIAWEDAMGLHYLCDSHHQLLSNCEEKSVE
jgi:hypothetical protein